eukprot:SAG31_NODE_36174_length_315_cov_3.981481_1_plen_32_part_10
MKEKNKIEKSVTPIHLPSMLHISFLKYIHFGL